MPKKELKIVCLTKDSDYRAIKDNMRDIKTNTGDIAALQAINFAKLNCMDQKKMPDDDDKENDTYEMRISLKFLSPISDCPPSTTAAPATTTAEAAAAVAEPDHAQE